MLPLPPNCLMGASMACVRFCAPVLVLIVLAGCASQSRPSRVGEVGVNERYESQMAAERTAQNHYAFIAPKAGATIRSDPPGALVEWNNQEGLWVSVGTTPTLEIAIEATGKPELFRVSMPGYLPQQRWVAATPRSDGVDVEFILEPELPADRRVFHD